MKGARASSQVLNADLDHTFRGRYPGFRRNDAEQKPVMMVAVRNSRHTFGLIEEAESFTVSVPTKDMNKELEVCGTLSGRAVDKFKECKLATRKAQKVSSPVLDIPGYHYECRRLYKSALDPTMMDKALDDLYPKKDYHTLYFGEIVACYQTD